MQNARVEQRSKENAGLNLPKVVASAAAEASSAAIRYQRLNDHTLIATTKKAGKVAEKATIDVSKDGKVTTVHLTAYSQGKMVKGVAVYEKQ